MYLTTDAFKSQQIRFENAAKGTNRPEETANYLRTKATQIRIDLTLAPGAPSNLGLILFVVALEEAAAFVLHISVKAL